MKLHTLFTLSLLLTLHFCKGDANETVAPAAEAVTPMMYLIEPFPRNATQKVNYDQFPCGGLAKGKTHLLTTPGAHSIVQWRTLRPAENATCMVRISNGIDNQTYFVALHPRDGSANSEGRFACGRYPNAYETKEFVFPEDLSCDRCTLQLVWEGPDFVHHHCADITIMSEQVKSCMGKCLNGGACVNGKCVCEEMYYGPYCEYKRKVEVSIGYLWIVYVVLLLAIIGFGAGAYLLYRKVKTAPVPTQPLTVAREEERKILPVTGAFAETPEEYENQEMRWKNENLLPIEEEEKDVRELPAKEEVKEVVVAQPGEEVKDQFE